jgi:hypothetical protein
MNKMVFQPYYIDKRIFDEKCTFFGLRIDVYREILKKM